MAADAALAMDPEFPNLDPAVVAGSRAALPHVCAEILDGELILQPRPKPREEAPVRFDPDSPFAKLAALRDQLKK